MGLRWSQAPSPRPRNYRAALRLMSIPRRLTLEFKVERGTANFSAASVWLQLTLSSIWTITFFSKQSTISNSDWPSRMEISSNFILAAGAVRVFRNEVNGDFALRRKNNRSLNYILQFTHIPRPIILHQKLQNLGSNLQWGFPFSSQNFRTK